MHMHAGEADIKSMPVLKDLLKELDSILFLGNCS